MNSSESGSITPRSEPKKPLIHDERLDAPQGAEPETNHIQAVEDQLAQQIENREEDVADKPKKAELEVN